MPANPPKRAIRTSYIVGFVRASSSVGFSGRSGDMRKKRVAVRMLMRTITRRLRAEALRSEVS